jgi:dephospho-CoA kinase
MIIGLTGTYCAGKNHIAGILEKRGLPVLDVDKLGHQVLEAEKELIFTQFGKDIQNPDGSLNRRLLGRLVHGNPEKLKQLEDIVHPGVNHLTDQWINDKNNAACVINAALLHKSSAFKKIDRIILVTAPFFTRFFRAKQRDKLSCKEIFKRFAAQKDFYTQYLSINSNSDCAEIYIVENPGLFKFNSRKLEIKIDKIIEGI